jgi:hypothetical protein
VANGFLLVVVAAAAQAAGNRTHYSRMGADDCLADRQEHVYVQLRLIRIQFGKQARM